MPGRLPVPTIGAGAVSDEMERTVISRIVFALLFGAIALSGCSTGDQVDQSKRHVTDGDVAAVAQFDQSKLCIAENDAEASKCGAGQLMFFRPARWGNEQLPLTAAALYCDFNHQIVQTNGGVVCVFTDKRLYLLE